MQKNKNLWAVVGFLLLLFGLLSLIFSMVGLQFSFMQWLDAGGRMLGFLARVGMVMAGFILLYFALSNFEGEDEEENEEDSN